MAKRAPSQRGSGETRTRIVEAAVETLKARGYTGTSARAIARAGGFNQALIFYYFGSVTDLLLAALDLTASQRMERYREEVEGVTSLPELMEVAARIYREDLEAGHITVLAELVAGASSAPELARELTARLEPWVAFTEETIQRVVGTSPLGALVPIKDAAYAIVALYLGIELLTHLGADRERVDSLFRSARMAADLITPLLQIPRRPRDQGL